MSGYGYHWTPCSGNKGGGAAVVVIILAVLAAGSGAASAIMSVLVAVLITVAAALVLGVAAVIAVVWRRSRHTRASWTPVTAPAAREAVAAPAKPQVTQVAQPPALEQHVHYHVHLAPGRDAVPVIPRAISEERSLCTL